MEYAHTHPGIAPICISISLLFLPLIAVEVRVTVHSAFMDIAAIRLLSLGIRKGNSYFCWFMQTASNRKAPHTRLWFLWQV